MKLSKKAKNINPSITLEITAKAKELKDSGVDVVSFSAGEPDFNTPSNILSAAVTAMNEGKTKYTATPGILELRKSICKKLNYDNGLDYNPNQIVVSTGAKQCLANVFMAILDDEDEVLVPVPYWVSYTELIQLAGGVPVTVENLKENSYKYDVKELAKKVTTKTKAILINSPNNPTGTIYSKAELMELAEFAKEHDIFIISDEIYEKLIYDEMEHVSIASLSKDAYERTIVINGFSKTYAMTGWRIGYTASSVELAKAMGSIQSHMTSNTNSITQYAAIEALEGPQLEINNMIIEFEKRRNYMASRLENINDITYIRPQGAFYIMVNIEAFYGKSINGNVINSSLDFSKIILEEKKVAVIPGEGFGLNGFIRLSYATSMENIETGLDRIGQFCNELI